MPEHTLPKGKRWIEGLVELGSALGYTAKPEFDVAPDGAEEAPVDVAWLGSADDDFPLFIFEVESKPGAQMTYNAGKVFGQDTDLFEKPLFHFHLVLTGGKTSGRIETASNLFGEFNYRVYRVAVDEATQALCDIFSQHRRVSRDLDVLATAAALDPSHWPDIDLDLLWHHIENCGFGAAWARDYGRLALAHEIFLPRLTRVLVSDAKSEIDIDGTQYGTFLGAHCFVLMHAAIVAQQMPECGAHCLDTLRTEQGDGENRAFAPRYGASQDYDGLIFSMMPAAWALLGAALADVDGARLWVLEQMELVILPEARVPFVLSALTAIWMLHVAAGEGEGGEPFYAKAAQMLNDGGGVPATMLTEPPMMGGSVLELDLWYDELTEDPQPVGDLGQFRQNTAVPAEISLTEIALRYLLEEMPPSCSLALTAALR